LGPALRLVDVAEVDLSGCATPTPAAGAPVVHLSNVSGAFVHGCRASAGTEVFLSVEGEASRAIVLGDNDLARAAQLLHVAAGVPAGAVSGAGLGQRHSPP
jgi:hypothetical protein